jgi:hypothetical protein
MKRIPLFPFAVLVLAAGCGEDDLTDPGVVTTGYPALNTMAGEDVTPPGRHSPDPDGVQFHAHDDQYHCRTCRQHGEFWSGR